MQNLIQTKSMNNLITKNKKWNQESENNYPMNLDWIMKQNYLISKNYKKKMMNYKLILINSIKKMNY